jgi:hypothetical protein
MTASLWLPIGLTWLAVLFVAAFDSRALRMIGDKSAYRNFHLRVAPEGVQDS